MAVIIQNKHLTRDIFRLRAILDPGTDAPLPGQFYMLRTWDRYPLLSRPISVFDYNPDNNTVDFVYQVVGVGTDILSRIAVSSNIQLDGPYGNGFPELDEDLVLIGGGIGLAPLYYAAKRHKELFPRKKIRTYLGFRNYAYCIEYFQNISNYLTYDLGSFITDFVTVGPHETVFSCGPEPMMRTVCEIVPKENDTYLSFERYMACGLGACLGCVDSVPIFYRPSKFKDRLELVPAVSKRFRICTDGPVFKRRVLT